MVGYLRFLVLESMHYHYNDKPKNYHQGLTSHNAACYLDSNQQKRESYGLVLHPSMKNPGMFLRIGVFFSEGNPDTAVMGMQKADPMLVKIK